MTGENTCYIHTHKLSLTNLLPLELQPARHILGLIPLHRPINRHDNTIRNSHNILYRFCPLLGNLPILACTLISRSSSFRIMSLRI